MFCLGRPSEKGTINHIFQSFPCPHKTLTSSWCRTELGTNYQLRRPTPHKCQEMAVKTSVK